MPTLPHSNLPSWTRLQTLKRRVVQGLLWLWLVAVAPAALAQPVVVAASDLKFALEEVAAQFQKSGGGALRLVFGSSGNFYRQIAQGAPFELFLSADENFVFQLTEAGLTQDRGQRYAVGRIGLFVPKGSVLRADGELKDLALALRDGRLKKFAMANPEHAPYGTRAREALQHAGLWTVIQPRLVLGENISQATQFATSGSAQGGIVAYSLALSPQVAAQGSFALIPEAWHQPLNQRMVLLRGAGDTARRFYAYLQGPAAQAVLRRHGFGLPVASQP
jgi:molybdate transport system substrate-binding protein